MTVTLTFNELPVYSNVMRAQEIKVTISNKEDGGLFLQIRTPHKVGFVFLLMVYNYLLKLKQKTVSTMRMYTKV